MRGFIAWESPNRITKYFFSVKVLKIRVGAVKLTRSSGKAEIFVDQLHLGRIEGTSLSKPHSQKAFRLIFTSDLPTSVGLSSSAALELASALTILQLAGKSLPKKELANLCRLAENEFVGLPCGILDQGTSAFGKKDHLVHIDCDDEVFGNIRIPARYGGMDFQYRDQT